MVAGLGLAGCVGDDEGDGDGSQPEPADRPPGVQADGLDIAILQETVESVIQEGAFSYEGYGRQRDLGAERQLVEGIRVTADNDARIGFTVEGERPGELTDPLDAPRVEMFYAEDDQAYEVEDFGTPDPVEGDFATVIEVATDHFAELLDYVSPLDWGSPTWDANEGYYVIPAVDVEDAPSAVTEATMHVDADGTPVGLVGQVALAPAQTSVDISFTAGVDVERPDWVAEAF